MTNLVFGTGAETRLAYVPEVTNGTTPASPTMTDLPFVKADLEFSQNTYKDATVYSDRMERNVIAGLRKVTGSLSGNLSFSNFSGLIQTLMWNTWASNVITTGNTFNSVTLEEWHSDISEGAVFTGCFVDKMSFKLPVNNICSFDATVNGMNMTTEVTQLASPTAAGAEQPFTCNAATLTEGGATIAILTSIDISVDNSAVAADVLGSQTPVTYVPGMSEVTGTITAYVPNFALFTKFLNQTSTALTVTLTDPAANTLEFNLPSIVYTGTKKPVQGQGALIHTLPFKAVRNSGISSNIQIARS